MTTMTFEEAFNRVPDGWLTEGEARLLWNTASKFTGPILEVGCYRGRSTVLLAYLGRLVYAVDPFDGFDSTMSGREVLKIFLENLMSREIENVILFSTKIEFWIYQPVTFAYLDGDHTYLGTRAQIQAARKAGAIEVGIHDYNETGGGKDIIRAVEDEKLIVLERVERLAICSFLPR